MQDNSDGSKKSPATGTGDAVTKTSSDISEATFDLVQQSKPSAPHSGDQFVHNPLQDLDVVFTFDHEHEVDGLDLGAKMEVKEGSEPTTEVKSESVPASEPESKPAPTPPAPAESSPITEVEAILHPTAKQESAVVEESKPKSESKPAPAPVIKPEPKTEPKPEISTVAPTASSDSSAQIPGHVSIEPPKDEKKPIIEESDDEPENDPFKKVELMQDEKASEESDEKEPASEEEPVEKDADEDDIPKIGVPISGLNPKPVQETKPAEKPEEPSTVKVDKQITSTGKHVDVSKVKKPKKPHKSHIGIIVTLIVLALLAGAGYLAYDYISKNIAERKLVCTISQPENVVGGTPAYTAKMVIGMIGGTPSEASVEYALNYGSAEEANAISQKSAASMAKKLAKDYAPFLNSTGAPLTRGGQIYVQLSFIPSGLVNYISGIDQSNPGDEILRVVKGKLEGLEYACTQDGAF